MSSIVRPAGVVRRDPGVARAMQTARKAGAVRPADLTGLPSIRPGDLWQLGAHRLLCADSTAAASVSAVMAGEQADLMVTDPPYGVRYTGRKLVRTAIRNDDLTGERFRRFLVAALSVAPLKAGGCFYICAPTGRILETFFASASQAGLEVRQSLIWVKNHFVVGHQDYHHKHEVLLYGWKPGAPHYYAGGRKQHTIWEYAKPQRSPLHPTTKPVALLERCIENNSRDGETVYDGFSGSGSTLIACEQTSRKCRAIEIEPQYCAVTVARWEAATGREAVLLAAAAELPLPSSDEEEVKS